MAVVTMWVLCAWLAAAALPFSGLDQQGLRWLPALLLLAGALPALWAFARARWQWLPGLVGAAIGLIWTLLDAQPGWGYSLTLMAFTTVSVLLLRWLPLFTLPAPDGPHAVSCRRFELMDQQRKGVLEDAADQPRQLQLHVWYPAHASSDHARMKWLGDDALLRANSLASGNTFPAFFFRHLLQVTGHGRMDAPVLEARERYPLLVFNHGYGLLATANTALCEHLASHGYVVLSIDHTLDCADLHFADGRIARLAPQRLAEARTTDPRPMLKASYGASFEARLEGLAAFAPQLQGSRLARSVAAWRDDVHFVVEAITSQDMLPTSVREVFAAADVSRRGHFGMSLGGSTAASACQADAGASAGVNLDGNLFDPALWDCDVRCPFLVFSSDWVEAAQRMKLPPDHAVTGTYCFSDLALERWRGSGAQSKVTRLRLKGSRHLSFTDLALAWRGPLGKLMGGSVTGPRAIAITNEVVRAFFDRHVRGDARIDVASKVRKFPEAEVRSAAALHEWVSQQPDAAALVAAQAHLPPKTLL